MCQVPLVPQPNPGLPPPGVTPLPLGEQASRRKPHDLAYLQSSGYLERLGFHYRPATVENTFRHPSQIRGK